MQYILYLDLSQNQQWASSFRFFGNTCMQYVLYLDSISKLGVSKMIFEYPKHMPYAYIQINAVPVVYERQSSEHSSFLFVDWIGQTCI